MPAVPMSTPTAPAMRLRIEERPLIDASMDSANTARAKYSIGRKDSAIFASSGVAARNTRRLMTPPQMLLTAARPSARPASPRWAMGNPSSAVAAAGGAPGALIRMAVMEPPKVPAQ